MTHIAKIHMAFVVFSIHKSFSWFIQVENHASLIYGSNSRTNVLVSWAIRIYCVVCLVSLSEEMRPVPCVLCTSFGVILK